MIGRADAGPDDRLGSRSLHLLDVAAGPGLVEPAYRYAVEALEQSPVTSG